MRWLPVLFRKVIELMDDWDGQTERRQNMSDLDAKLGRLASSLDEIQANQHGMCRRLEEIEKNISKAEGAWWVARYVIGPLMVSALVGILALDELVSRHVSWPK